MRRTLAFVAAVVLAGCVQPRSGVRVIDGVPALCTWRDHKLGPDGDLRCEPLPTTTTTSTP